MSQAERTRALQQLAGLPIDIDSATSSRAWEASLGLADQYRLTLYDAVYLELAIREHLPLATLDQRLRRAAAAAGVNLLGN